MVNFTLYIINIPQVLSEVKTLQVDLLGAFFGIVGLLSIKLLCYFTAHERLLKSQNVMKNVVGFEPFQAQISVTIKHEILSLYKQSRLWLRRSVNAVPPYNSIEPYGSQKGAPMALKIVYKICCSI